MEQYTTRSTSRHSAKLTEPVVIDETATTRKVVYVIFNDFKEADETVGISIVHQRKGKRDEWIDVESQSLNSLKAGEAKKMILDSASTRRLYEKLKICYKIMEEVGIPNGIEDLTIARADELLKVDSDRKLIIERMLNEDYDQEVWEALVDNKPDLASKLSLAKIQTDRMAVLDEFRRGLEEQERSENYWQKFFENNTWVFGYGLNYQFLHLLADQPLYGGGSVFGTGNQKGDYLLNSSAEAQFTVLVEIKTPSAKMFKWSDGQPRKVRSGVYEISDELVKAVSQIQVNTRTWATESQSNPNNVRNLERSNIFTVEPKSILVYGDTREVCDDVEYASCFELFRRNLRSPEIITYDELLRRAEYIVGSVKKDAGNKMKEDDLPF